MKVKIYEKVDALTIWFFMLVGIACLIASIWNNISSFNIWNLLFYLALAVGSFFLGFKYLKMRRNGKFVETIIKCEKIEEIK